MRIETGFEHGGRRRHFITSEFLTTMHSSHISGWYRDKQQAMVGNLLVQGDIFDEPRKRGSGVYRPRIVRLQCYVNAE